MGGEEKQLPDLEVVLTCTKCCMVHTPKTKDQILPHCVKCGAASNFHVTPTARYEFVESVNVLITDASKAAELGRALKTASAKSDEGNLQLTVSIRARKGK